MYLLDTNALIIFFYQELANGKLSDKAIDIMLGTDELYVSVVSFWEIAIKIKLKKLGIKTSIRTLEEKCRQENIGIIPIRSSHLDRTLDLPIFDNHKDPFDRLLIAIADVENLTLITTDEKIRSHEYGISTIS